MLFGSRNFSYLGKRNIFVWMIMAMQAGMLNIGGFMACQRFVSHVTGFAAFFGVDVVQRNYKHAFGMLAVPFFFLIGSMVSGSLIDIRLLQQKRPYYYISFGLTFILIAFIFFAGRNGLFGPFGESIDNRGDYLFLAILCMVCGMQNGTITTISRSVIRTTHLTGITTDLGIGIMRVLYWGKTKNVLEANEGAINWIRIGLIIFFIIGSSIGAHLYQNYQYSGFIVPTVTSGLIFLTTWYFQFIRKKISTSL
jgi:uncharacterized membrane protein YoaK (UPF0700 family)